jgi:hypothetical protein
MRTRISKNRIFPKKYEAAAAALLLSPPNDIQNFIHSILRSNSLGPSFKISITYNNRTTCATSKMRLRCGCAVFWTAEMLLTFTLVTSWMFRPQPAPGKVSKNGFHVVHETSSLRCPSRIFLQDFRDDVDDENEASNYFEDFDYVIGGTKDNNIMPEDLTMLKGNNDILQDRMQQLVETEQAAQQQISDNWKEGYWNVWGCSLDPFVLQDDADTSKTVVTCLRLGSTMDEDENDQDSALLIVGRSDGSLVWLKMDSATSSYNQNDRSIVTYFENKLTAKSTQDGGMTIGSELQRSNPVEEVDDVSTPPFDIVAQLSTTSAIVDMLVLPDATMLWTIHQDAPHLVQATSLSLEEETGFLLPSNNPEQHILQAVHTAPIVAMKSVPGHDSLVITVSKDGQTVIWEINSSGDVLVRYEGNLLEIAAGEERSDVLLSMDVDDEFLFLGTLSGQILVFSLATMMHNKVEVSSEPVLVKRFVGFSNREPGVSAVCVAAPGTLSGNDNKAPINSGRPPTKTLIAGNILGELKQWELIPTRDGNGLEYWPRMASQKLPGKAHVFDTNSYMGNIPGDLQSSAIRQVLVIQHVILVSTNHDLRFWDPFTGKSLYDMQGLNFPAVPSLVVAKDSVLVTNGMDQYVCVHDFAMERVISENAQDMIERDDHE